MSLGELRFLVGLPASGKSTFAARLSKDTNSEILSSDELRKELYGDTNDQTDHNFIFNELYSRANKLLTSGVNVIIDATNINRKRRIHIINHEIKANKKIAYYMNTHFEDCVFRNIERDRSVPYNVIERMYKNLQIPIKTEGWDDVVFVTINKWSHCDKDSLEDVITNNLNHEDIFQKLSENWLIPEFKDIFNLPHDSTYHSLSVSRHTYYVYKYLHQISDDLALIYAALFHDLGKGFCKSFRNYNGQELRYANFIGHEHVSSQLASYYLTQHGYNDKFVKDVTHLCQFHMYPMNAGSKKMKEIERLLGEKLFKKLLLLHDADKQAK